MAFSSALAGEQEYLKDNDFIGGITCRIKGAENLLHQEKYPESYEFIVPYHDKFSKILENHQNEGLRGHLNLVLSMITIYNNRHEEFILTSLEALTYSLAGDRQGHVIVANKIRDIGIMFNVKRTFDGLINRILDLPRLQPVSNELIAFMKEGREQKWVVCDSDSAYHVPDCQRYRKGHYLKTANVYSVAAIIDKNNIVSCPCMRNGNAVIP